MDERELCIKMIRDVLDHGMPQAHFTTLRNARRYVMGY